MRSTTQNYRNGSTTHRRRIILHNPKERIQEQQPLHFDFHFTFTFTFTSLSHFPFTFFPLPFHFLSLFSHFSFSYVSSYFLPLILTSYFLKQNFFLFLNLFDLFAKCNFISYQIKRRNGPLFLKCCVLVFEAKASFVCGMLF